MKCSSLLCVTHVLCALCLSFAASAQTVNNVGSGNKISINRENSINTLKDGAGMITAAAPTRTDAQKLAVRNAQHKLDGIDRQILTWQQNAQQVRAQAQAELEKAEADYKVGVDEKLWQVNWETLDFAATPPTTAAPATASTQPPKPSPTSPGAAAPPKVEQAKK